MYHYNDLIEKQNFDVPTLIDKSNYIQSKCINEKQESDESYPEWTPAKAICMPITRS